MLTGDNLIIPSQELLATFTMYPDMHVAHCDVSVCRHVSHIDTASAPNLQGSTNRITMVLSETRAVQM